MALKQNINYIYFKGKHLVTSKSQYQYNHGQFLYFADLDLPQTFEVHFSNRDRGDSKPQVGSNKLVEIPDEYYWSGALMIYAWIYLHTGKDDGETVYEVRIPLAKRAKPTDEEPLPQQQGVIDRTIAELNNAVNVTTENANKTEADKTIVSNIKEDVITLKGEIDSTATTINQKAQETINASGRAETSAQNAATSENKALNYSQQAEQSAQSALESKNIAQQKSEVATNASSEALGYKNEALEAKNQAVQAKQNIVDYRDETKGYRDETLTAKNDAQTIKSDVQSLKTQIDKTATDVEINALDAKSSADLSYRSAISADNASLSASQFADEASDFADSASQSASQAEEFKNQSATNVTHYPKVVDGYWYIWDASKNDYVNTNVDARGVKGDKGDVGETGNGIENTVLNSDYTLTITFTDGTSYTTPSIRGEKGLKGDVGNGIASTVLNNDYTLTINFTDGTQYTTPPIRGKQGEKGDQGETGDSGVYIGTDEPTDENVDVWIDTDENEDSGTVEDLIEDITELKENFSNYIYGANNTSVTISATGSNRFHFLILKGVKYSFTNKTSAGCTVNYLKADGTTESISGGLNSNNIIYFTPSRENYIGFACYFNGTGTVEINSYFSAIEAFDNISDSVNNGIIPLGKLIPNRYITATGEEAGYGGWSETDYLPIGLLPILRITSTAGNGGNYDAFYDSSKQFISNFSLTAGVKDITVPDNAVYFRLSNSTSALENTIVENIVGYLNRKVIELEPTPASTPSIYEWNIDESMVVNAGANYGFHSSGQSNVQKRFSMLVTTDPHGDATAMKRAVDYLNDMPCFDCGCCLGDLQANTFSDNDGTWYTNAIKDAGKPWLTLVGNHDVGIGKSIASTGNQEQVYEKFIEPNLQYAGVTPDDKSYYYKDFATYKIRLICLNPYDVDNDDTSGSEYVVPRYTEYYSQAQINWLVSLLANTPSDYHLMILTHNTPKASTKDTSVNFNNKTYSFSPESSQGGIVADIVDAWQRGTTLSHTYTCTNANLDNVTVSADFTSRGVGVLICFLTGHMHVDAIGHITSFANQNVFTLASTNTGTWQNDWSDLPRADGTKAEDCITAIAVDTTNRDIYISRIGSSVSRWFTVREPSVISY